MPTSRKAELRQWARMQGLPNPRDSLELLRFVRDHPILTLPTDREKAQEKEQGIDGLEIHRTTPPRSLMADNMHQQILNRILGIKAGASPTKNVMQNPTKGPKKTPQQLAAERRVRLGEFFARAFTEKANDGPVT